MEQAIFYNTNFVLYNIVWTEKSIELAAIKN